MKSPGKPAPGGRGKSGDGPRLRLEADEPGPFEVVNAGGGSDVMLIADHASNAVPRSLQALGLDEEALASHIAWDAGTAIVARRLSELLDAPLVLSNYSRLVIDCNRRAGSAQSIPGVSDGVQIPGNLNLGPEEIAGRKQVLFDPYHRAIKEMLDTGRVKAMLSIHSFTPAFQGKHRPWSIGVCYGEDRRLAHVMLPVLSRLVPGPLGDNEPYSIEKGIDYSLPRHAESRGLLHVMLEIRRDKIEDRDDALTMAELLGKAWHSIAAARPPSEIRPENGKF